MVGAGIVGWLAWRLLGSEPRPAFAPHQVHPWPLPGRSVFVDGTELFVRRLNEGGGRPIVLIHGWGDHTAIVWQCVAPALGATRDVIMVDQRNHGRSSRRRGRYEIEDVADDTAAVIRQLGFRSVDIVGYSMGGMVAQALAWRHPALVDTLVLGATTAGAVPRWRQALSVGVLVAGRALDRVSRVELSVARYWYLIRRGVVGREHAQWLWDEQMARDPELYWQAGFAAVRFDSRSYVGRITAPTLVIIPTSDQLVAPRQQRDLFTRLRGAALVELVGARHEAPLTHAAEIARAIESFTGERRHDTRAS